MRAAGILLVSVWCIIVTNEKVDFERRDDVNDYKMTIIQGVDESTQYEARGGYLEGEVSKPLKHLLNCGAVLPPSLERIAGGASASINQYPFSTALITTLGTGSVYLQACGGSILTTNAVLSAASCFQTDGESHPVHWWRARVGSTFANAGGFTHMVRLITAHPGYISTVGDNDLAVLRTTIPFTFAQGLVGPASIAGAVLTLNTNQPVSAIGWGLPSGTAAESSPELRQVQYWVVNHETCRNRYNTVGFTVTDNMLCSGWLDVGVRGQCQGDTGSPLLNADGVVVGVYSWTNGECAEGWFPDVNTKVSVYTRWIVEAAYA